MSGPICKVVYDAKHGVTFESAISAGSTLEEIIQDDKKYGKLPLPANGIVTYAFYGAMPRGLDKKKLERSFRLALSALMQITSEIKGTRELKQVELDAGVIPTFRIYTRSSTQDQNLSGRTIMYAYYPLNSLTNGIIVINKDDFYFTIHGNSTSMYDIDPVHYPEDTKVKGETIDVDTVFRHELKHILGVPHDPAPANNMSASYGFISEFDTMRDIVRVQAKYIKRTLSQRLADRFKAAFRIISDR